MNRTLPFAAAAAIVALAACSQEPAAPGPGETPATSAPSPERSMPATDAGRTFPSGAWQMASSGEGDGLFFGVTEGEPATLHLFCPSDGGLLVNVNAFRPVGSEERMSFGSGATVVALVADPAGDANRGGVSGEGPVPSALSAILTGSDGVSASYGTQTIAVPPVPGTVARDFVTGCTD